VSRGWSSNSSACSAARDFAMEKNPLRRAAKARRGVVNHACRVLPGRKATKWLVRRAGTSRSSRLLARLGGLCTGRTLAEASSQRLTSAHVESVQFRGDSDVRSQSSMISHPGSVALACRQLLGPLCDSKPPPHTMNQQIEDHLLCVSDMVCLRATVATRRLAYQRDVSEWKEKCHQHAVSRLVHSSPVPDALSEAGIDDPLWSMVQNCISVPLPGPMPAMPDLPDDEDLWAQACKEVYGDF
jgi:hypothetical protein